MQNYEVSKEKTKEEWQKWKEDNIQKLDEKSKTEGWYQSGAYWEWYDAIKNADFYKECKKKGIKI